jgi:hypothetical protein
MSMKIAVRMEKTRHMVMELTAMRLVVEAGTRMKQASMKMDMVLTGEIMDMVATHMGMLLMIPWRVPWP